MKSSFGRTTFCTEWVTSSQIVVPYVMLVCSFQNSENWRKLLSVHCCLGDKEVSVFLGGF